MGAIYQLRSTHDIQQFDRVLIVADNQSGTVTYVAGVVVKVQLDSGHEITTNTGKVRGYVKVANQGNTHNVLRDNARVRR